MVLFRGSGGWYRNRDAYVGLLKMTVEMSYGIHKGRDVDKICDKMK